jgi:hypothetical protein
VLPDTHTAQKKFFLLIYQTGDFWAHSIISLEFVPYGGFTMTQKIIVLLSVLALLAGCASREMTTTVYMPTATAVRMPSRVVTLSNNTPLAVTVTPPLVGTAPAGFQVTLKGDEFVNLRSGPGAVYPVVGRAANGAILTAVARSEHGEWLLLVSSDLPDGQAWVYAAYTDYDPAVHPLPAATPVLPAPQP